MGGKRKTPDYSKDKPATLDEHPFYGLDLDTQQLAFANAIWDSSVRFISVDAAAGSGKTTIAVAVSCLLKAYGVVDQCVYCRTPSSEGRIGFLPGTQTSKERPYMQPLYNSLINLGENPFVVVDSAENLEGKKFGDAYWRLMTDVYMLGDDFKRTAFIIDEAQCMTTGQLRTIITRLCDDCKCIVIGSTLQIQGISPEESGFTHCIEHFESKEWARHCVLTKNYRGEMSAWADRL